MSISISSKDIQENSGNRDEAWETDNLQTSMNETKMRMLCARHWSQFCLLCANHWCKILSAIVLFVIAAASELIRELATRPVENSKILKVMCSIYLHSMNEKTKQKNDTICNLFKSKDV